MRKCLLNDLKSSKYLHGCYLFMYGFKTICYDPLFDMNLMQGIWYLTHCVFVRHLTLFVFGNTNCLQNSITFFCLSCIQYCCNKCIEGTFKMSLVLSAIVHYKLRMWSIFVWNSWKNYVINDELSVLSTPRSIFKFVFH